jgi:hypothetical protein
VINPDAYKRHTWCPLWPGPLAHLCFEYSFRLSYPFSVSFDGSWLALVGGNVFLILFGWPSTHLTAQKLHVFLGPSSIRLAIPVVTLIYIWSNYFPTVRSRLWSRDQLFVWPLLHSNTKGDNTHFTRLNCSVLN